MWRQELDVGAWRGAGEVVDGLKAELLEFPVFWDELEI